MGQTAEGRVKARQTLLSRDPDYFKKLGSKGGKNGTGHKFAHGKVDPHLAGQLGGSVRPRDKNG
jgi:general stress protein YciG